jgi:2'-5' RNA ligase
MAESLSTTVRLSSHDESRPPNDKTLAHKKISMTAPPQPAPLRLFIAVELDDPTRLALTKLADSLAKAARFTPARLVWVPPQNFHLTLFFLGATPPGIAHEIARQMQYCASNCAPFALDVRHISTFPQTRGVPPKVLWVGIHRPPEALTALREAMADALRAAGARVPDQNFTPHITLARFKSTKGLTPLMNQIRPYQFTHVGVSRVDRVTLMESLTGDGPAVYRPVQQFPLAQSEEVGGGHAANQS